MTPLAFIVRMKYDYLMTLYGGGYIQLNEQRFEMCSHELNPIFNRLMRPLSRMFRDQVRQRIHYDALMSSRSSR